MPAVPRSRRSIQDQVRPLVPAVLRKQHETVARPSLRRGGSIPTSTTFIRTAPHPIGVGAGVRSRCWRRSRTDSSRTGSLSGRTGRLPLLPASLRGEVVLRILSAERTKERCLIVALRSRAARRRRTASGLRSVPLRRRDPVARRTRDRRPVRRRRQASSRAATSSGRRRNRGHLVQLDARLVGSLARPREGHRHVGRRTLHHGEVVDDASVLHLGDRRPAEGSSVTHGTCSAVGTAWATGIVPLALSQDAVDLVVIQEEQLHPPSRRALRSPRARPRSNRSGGSSSAAPGWGPGAARGLGIARGGRDRRASGRAEAAWDSRRLASPRTSASSSAVKYRSACS